MDVYRVANESSASVSRDAGGPMAARDRRHNKLSTCLISLPSPGKTLTTAPPPPGNPSNSGLEIKMLMKRSSEYTDYPWENFQPKLTTKTIPEVKVLALTLCSGRKFFRASANWESRSSLVINTSLQRCRGAWLLEWRLKTNKMVVNQMNGWCADCRVRHCTVSPGLWLLETLPWQRS